MSALTLPESMWRTSLHPSQEATEGDWQPCLKCCLLTEVPKWGSEMETNDWPRVSTSLLLILAMEIIVKLFSVWRVTLHSFSVLYLEECCRNSKQISSPELHSPWGIYIPSWHTLRNYKNTSAQRGKWELIFKGAVRNQLPLRLIIVNIYWVPKTCPGLSNHCIALSVLLQSQ